MRKFILLLLVVVIFGLTLYGAHTATVVGKNLLMVGVLERYIETGARNAVTAVYLDYRIFDTLFETFLLLVSVMGLSQFLRLENTEQIHMEADTPDTYRPSPIARSALRNVLPLLVIFGLSVTAFGANSPGGGFQGGAILATIVMVSYLTTHTIRGTFGFYTTSEEWLYIAFLLIVGGYFLFYTHFTPVLRTAYLTLSSFIICFKVNMGLIVVFLRLIGQSEHRTARDAYE